MGRKSELNVRVNIDPVLDRDKFNEDVDKLTKTNPVPIHGKIDAEEALSSIADYQQKANKSVPIVAKISNAKAALDEAFTNRHDATPIKAEISAGSLAVIKGQLQDVIDSLDLSKLNISATVSNSGSAAVPKTVKQTVEQTVVQKGVPEKSLDSVKVKIQDNARSESNRKTTNIHSSKKIITIDDDKILNQMAEAQAKAAKAEESELAAAKQKNIIYQNLVDHQAKAAENATDACNQTARGLSSANKAMSDLNVKSEAFEQNWKRIVTLIAGATRDLTDLMVGEYGAAKGKGMEVFGAFQEFDKELPNLDTYDQKEYLAKIKNWANDLIASVNGEFDPSVMQSAIHMFSGLADTWSKIDPSKLTDMVTMKSKKENVLQSMTELQNIFPSSTNGDPFWGAKESAINYLVDLLGNAAKYYAEVGSAAKQTADSIETANQGFANQTAQLKQTNAELEKAKQNIGNVSNSSLQPPISSDISEDSLSSLKAKIETGINPVNITPEPAAGSLTKLKTDIEAGISPIEVVVKQKDEPAAPVEEVEKPKKKSKKKTEQVAYEAEQLSFDSPELVVPGNASTKVDDTKPVDLHGKVVLTADDVIPPEAPVDIPGKITLTDKDITVPDKIDLNGNLVIKNATKEIKTATKEAEAEVSKESKKASKKDAEKEKQRKKKEYLLALGSLLKKNANAQNELSDMYPGAPDYKELQNYIGKLHRRTGTTVNLLDTLVGRDGWKNDVLYTSAVEDSMHIRSRKKAGDKTSETIKAGIAEEKEYVSILKQIPDLEEAAAKALADFGDQSVHYQDANKKLTDAKDTVGAFEQKYGEAYSDLLRSEVIEQQNLSKAMAQEKAIRDAQLAQEEEANKKRIADEKKYLSLLTQETKDHQTALEVQREYGDKDFRTQYAMEDWQKSNTDLKTLEATVKKQSGSLSNVPGYNEIVEKNRRSWMQWGQDQQDISAKQRAADLKDNTSLLNNYNKVLETQAKLLQGLYKIDQSKDPGGYAAKQIALQSNAINVANLRKDIKSRGLNDEAAYTDANAKYLAGINAANLTKAQKAKEATDKAATNAKKKQDEWVKKTESIISEAEKKYIDAFKAIQKEQDDLNKTSDQQTKNDINSCIAQKQAEMDDAKKVLDNYNSTANGLVQEAWGRIDYQTKGSEIQDQIAYEAKSGKEAVATKKENLDLLKQYNQSLDEELKLLKQVYVAETAEDKVAAQNALNDQKDKTDRLRYQLKGKGLDTTSDYQKYNTQNALNEAAINAKYNGTSIEDLKNTYIKNLREREANINAAYSTEDADKIARITQRIEDNNNAIQEAGFALTQFGQKADNAWAEISKVNDELDIAAEQKFNKALEAQTKQADTQAKKAISDNEKLLNRIERAMRNQEKAYSDYQSSEDNTQDKETKLGRLNIRNEELKGLRQQAGTRGLTVTQEYLTLEKQHREEILGIDEALQKRAQAEQEAIRVQDKDRLSLLAYIKTIEKYKDTLEKDDKTDSSVYGKSVGMSNASWDLLNELNKNPDNKDQVAYLWGQKYNIQGVTDLESAFKALAVEAAKAGIEVQDLRTETEKLRAVTQAKTNIANLKSQLIDYLEKFPKVGKALAEPVQKLQEALADPNAYKNAGQLKQAMAELRAQAKSLGLESENLIDKFEKLFGQHLSTMITMAALHKMQDALRIVYKNVVEIDTAVTELRKVSEYAGKSLEEYMGRAAEQAQKLGVSISDYVNSTADWKRLGYSDKDAENLATYSTLLKNVGDNIDDVNTSSSYLISTLQGFGLLADQAEDVVNKIDAVANTQPVTAKDLGEILTRSSAAMSAANNTLEETIALGTAANAVIQDADTVGTTLKSLSMYLRAAKSDAENAGIEVDGMANSVSELRSELKSLTGVDIMLDSKNFKSTYQIMKELSQVWSGLSDVTQANVTEMIGGKRNANAVSAILNNFDVAESAMESAANSANVAWEENEKWLDSIQGRLGQLDASFQVLSQDVLSSGLVKTGVSFLTSIVKLLDKIINLTGALPAGLGIAAFATQLGKPKMTGFMIVPSNTPGGDTEQVLRRYFIISLRSMREYLVKPTNMVA